MKKSITPQEIATTTSKYLAIVEQVYGYSKYHQHTPYLHIYENRVLPDQIKGEYCHLFNEIVIYADNIQSHEDLIRVLVHEYQHYLQSPTWFKRYYSMGHTYESHPYEVAAYKEEENWKQIWKIAS